MTAKYERLFREHTDKEEALQREIREKEEKRAFKAK